MDVAGIKNYIIDNPDTIVLLLDSAEFSKIKSTTTEIRCAKDEYSNPTSIKINTNTLSSVCFSNNVKGDIITLLQDKLGYTFVQTLQWIVITLGLSEDMFKTIEVKPPFGGYFKSIGKSYENKIESRILPPIILKEYESYPNVKFYKDGISFDTQAKFRIGYDCFTKRISIPWFNTMGELIGIMGRLNKDELEDGELKYLPIIPFKKESVLYGYDVNYANILQKDMCIITEAEKGVMQLDSMGCQIGLGLGGNSITDIRANLIKGMGVSKIILALDEGLDIDVVKADCAKIKVSNGFYSNKVGYIHDPNGDIMPIGSKCSPTDLGIVKFRELLKECVVWV